MSRACPYCKSPAQRNPCWWFIDNPQLAHTGADAPCCDYDYDRDDRARFKKDLRPWLWGIVVGIVTVCWLLAGMPLKYR